MGFIVILLHLAQTTLNPTSYLAKQKIWLHDTGPYTLSLHRTLNNYQSFASYKLGLRNLK